MAQLLVVFDERSSTTVENIFSSNVETVKTLGNILFTEKVSEFYLNRKQLYDMFGLLSARCSTCAGNPAVREIDLHAIDVGERCVQSCLERTFHSHFTRLASTSVSGVRSMRVLAI